MATAPSSRPRQLVLSIGLALAVGLASALALWPRVMPGSAMETTDAFEAWMLAHPEAVSVLIWNMDTGVDLVDRSADRVRPVVGLPALLLAAFCPP